jgi:hypothetical protein
VLQQGKGVTEIGSQAEKQRAAFLIGLNNLRTSIQCVCTLKAGLAEDFQKHLGQVFKDFIQMLELGTCLDERNGE